MNESKSEITQAVSGISNGVADAHQLVSDLAQKIDPVLTQVPEEAVKDVDKAEANSTLGSTLHTIRADVEALLVRLRRVADRVQL